MLATVPYLPTKGTWAFLSATGTLQPSVSTLPSVAMILGINAGDGAQNRAAKPGKPLPAPTTAFVTFAPNNEGAQ
jgi:hypothetical protein